MTTPEDERIEVESIHHDFTTGAITEAERDQAIDAIAERGRTARAANLETIELLDGFIA